MRDVCGENAIIGEGLEAVNFNKLIALNDTAAWLWEKAAELGDFTAQQLADALCQEYDVTPERALADVEKLIASWQSAGIVE